MLKKDIVLWAGYYSRIRYRDGIDSSEVWWQLGG